MNSHGFPNFVCAQKLMLLFIAFLGTGNSWKTLWRKVIFITINIYIIQSIIYTRSNHLIKKLFLRTLRNTILLCKKKKIWFKNSVSVNITLKCFRKQYLDTLMARKSSLIAQLVKNLPECRRPQFDCWVRKICWRRDRLPTPVFLGFPCGLAGKVSACSVGDLGSSLRLGRSPGEGKGYPLQYSGQKNSMDYIVHVCCILC